MLSLLRSFPLHERAMIFCGNVNLQLIQDFFLIQFNAYNKYLHPAIL